MSNFKLKLLIYFAAISVSSLLISNIAAIKLWDFFSIPVDGGIVLFPILYILGDLIMEFYGEKIAKNVIFAGFLVNIIAVCAIYLVIALPSFDGWNLQDAYASVLGFTPRIILASLCAYVCSSLFNNFIFAKLKKRQGIFQRSFIARALGSSLVAHFIDSAIFEIVAFLGVLAFQDFLKQAAFAYVLGIAFEILLSPLEACIANYLKGKMVYYDEL